jgi:hypothetical protein
MKPAPRSSYGAAGNVVCVDFFLAADGEHVDHITTSLPPKEAKRLPSAFDTVQEGRGALIPLITKRCANASVPLTIMFTTHPAPEAH